VTKNEENPELATKLEILNTRIASYLDNSYNEFVSFALSYLQLLVQEKIDEIEIPTSEPIPQARKNIDISSYYQGEKTIIAGEESVPIIKIEYIASLEEMLIENLRISTSIDMGKYLQEINLYDAEGNWLASTQPLGFVHTFKDINLYLQQGSNYIYLTLTPHRI